MTKREKTRHLIAEDEPLSTVCEENFTFSSFLQVTGLKDPLSADCFYKSFDSRTFLETCMLRAAQTSAVTEIHNTIKSLSRCFLSMVIMSPHFYSSSLFSSWFSDSFSERAAQVSAAKEIHNTIMSLLNNDFIMRQPPYTISLTIVCP